MELKVLKKEIGALAINYEELKQELTTAVTLYDNIKVVEDVSKYSVLHTTEEGYSIYTDNNGSKFVTFQDAKGIRAKLNKVSDVINNRKKDLKKEFLRPYEIVDSQAKELMGIIANVNEEIDAQVKKAEEKERAEKIEAIMNLWVEKNYCQLGIDFAHAFDAKWTNKTYSMAKIEEEMADKYLTFKNELDSIEKLVPDKKKALLLKTKYCLNPNLSQIISDYNAENEKAKELMEKTKNIPDLDYDVTEEELDLEHPSQKFKVVIFVDEYQLNDLMKYCSDNNLNAYEIKEEEIK